MKRIIFLLAVMAVLFTVNDAQAILGDTKPFYTQTAIYGRTDTDITNVSGKWYPYTLKADGSMDARLTNGAPELTEYQVDESNWDIYGSITTTSSVGYTFKTVTNNYIDYVDINLKNTTAVNLNNITMFLSFYGDTVSYPLIKQVSTKDTWAHADTKLVRFLVGLPILNNRTYYWELTSDTTVTNIQAVLVSNFPSPDTYSRGTAYINRTTCYDTGSPFQGVPFNMYTRSMNFVTFDQNDTQLYGYVHVKDIDTGFVEITDLDTGICDVPWVGNVDKLDSGYVEVTDINTGVADVPWVGDVDSVDMVDSGFVEVTDVNTGQVDVPWVGNIDKLDSGYVEVTDVNTGIVDVAWLGNIDKLDSGYVEVTDVNTGVMDVVQVDNISSLDKVDSGFIEITDVDTGIMDIAQVDNISSVDKVDSGYMEITDIDTGQMDVPQVDNVSSVDKLDSGFVEVTRIDTGNMTVIITGQGGDPVTVSEAGELYISPSPSRGDSIGVNVLDGDITATLTDTSVVATLSDTAVEIPDGVNATLTETGVVATLSDSNVTVPSPIFIKGRSGDSVAVSPTGEMYVSPDPSRGDSFAVYMVGGTLATTSADSSVNIPEGVTLADSNVKVETGLIRLWDTTRYSSILGNSAVADAATKLGVASEVEDFDLSGGTEDYTGAMGLLGASTSGAKPVYVDAANGRLEVIVQDLTDSTVQMTYDNTGNSVPVTVVNSPNVYVTDGTSTAGIDAKLDFLVTETVWEKNILAGAAYTGDSYMYLAGSSVETWCVMVHADTMFTQFEIKGLATVTYAFYEVGNTVAFGTALSAPRNLNRSSSNTSTANFYSGTTADSVGTLITELAGTAGTMDIILKPYQAYMWIIKNTSGGSETAYCRIKYFNY